MVLLSACSRPEPGATAASGGSGPTPLVDPADIISGGPPPDGIPPIDDPKFADAAAVDFLSPQEPVISLVLGHDARAYPAQILVWHEIVNDTVGGVPVTVTYCPLCNTGIAFRRPVIEGKLLDFGTSGKLYHSNLVMYDRQTESLWPQALGQAVMGPLTGTKLELVPVQMVAWADWLAEHPQGRVLSTDTGADRPYGQNPYEGYDRPDSAPFLFQGTPDPAPAEVQGSRGSGRDRCDRIPLRPASDGRLRRMGSPPCHGRREVAGRPLERGRCIGGRPGRDQPVTRGRRHGSVRPAPGRPHADVPGDGGRGRG